MMLLGFTINSRILIFAVSITCGDAVFIALVGRGGLEPPTRTVNGFRIAVKVTDMTCFCCSTVELPPVVLPIHLSYQLYLYAAVFLELSPYYQPLPEKSFKKSCEPKYHTVLPNANRLYFPCICVSPHDTIYNKKQL